MRIICSSQNKPLCRSAEEPRHDRYVLSADDEFMEANMGRGILLWLLGVPIPVIILLWLFFGR
jgi:hypothetical protein